MGLILKSKLVWEEFMEDFSTKEMALKWWLLQHNTNPEPGAESQDGTKRRRRRSQELCLHFHCAPSALGASHAGSGRELWRTDSNLCGKLPPDIPLSFLWHGILLTENSICQESNKCEPDRTRSSSESKERKKETVHENIFHNLQNSQKEVTFSVAATVTAQRLKHRKHSL